MWVPLYAHTQSLCMAAPPSTTGRRYRGVLGYRRCPGCMSVLWECCGMTFPSPHDYVPMGCGTMYWRCCPSCSRLAPDRSPQPFRRCVWTWLPRTVALPWYLPRGLEWPVGSPRQSETECSYILGPAGCSGDLSRGSGVFLQSPMGRGEWWSLGALSVRHPVLCLPLTY